MIWIVGTSTSTLTAFVFHLYVLFNSPTRVAENRVLGAECAVVFAVTVGSQLLWRRWRLAVGPWIVTASVAIDFGDVKIAARKTMWLSRYLRIGVGSAVKSIHNVYVLAGRTPDNNIGRVFACNHLIRWWVRYCKYVTYNLKKIWLNGLWYFLCLNSD